MQVLCSTSTWRRRRTDQFYGRLVIVFIELVQGVLCDTCNWALITLLLCGVMQLGALVEGMEKESGFLYDPDKKELLGTILPQILRDLTLHGECTIPVDTTNIINLKLFPTLQDPAAVFEYQVPVAIRDLRALLENSGALFGCCLFVLPFSVPSVLRNSLARP